ncbi:MAG TPA: VWA domain-containing protein, partial [Burkholderiaceae bacterium]|nr:VWA domain-containing protein [Burkholderiaceae bacterium]
MVRHLLLGLISLFVAASPALAESAEPTTDAILILDGSGSMWARMDGEPRIVVAKKVISNLLDELPDSTRLGLMAYGHNRKGDCGDIEMLVDVGGKRSAIKKAVDGVSPKGKTPMTDAVIQAAEKLKYTENAATIILVSDGEETCNVDPCEAAERLNELGVSLKVHTVGFALEEGSEGLNQLQCMAENTGGQFFATQNAQELASALTTITEEQPEQKPVTPASFTVALSATSGQDGPVIEDDLVWTIQAEGDDQPVYTSEPGGSTSAELEPGTYHTSVLRISDEAGAEAAFDITDADTRVVLALEAEHAVSITAPDSAVHGSDIEISWTDATDPLDLIVIVPADTKEGEYKGG